MYTNNSVKNLNKYGLLAVILATTLNVYAGGTQVKNFVGVWAEAGDWTLLTRGSTLPNSLGGGGGIGFSYDLQANHFILDLGVGITGGQTIFRVPDFKSVLPNQIDAEGDAFNYVYSLTDRKDAYSNMMVQIPILFGGQYKRFYALAGVKFGFSAVTQAHISGSLTTYGSYFIGDKQVWDDFRDMPELQFFTDKAVSAKTNTNFDVNLDVSIEIGARLGFMSDHTGFDVPKSKVQYRLALFADYGVLDIHKAQNNPALVTQNIYNQEDMISGLRFGDILSTSNAASAINNLFVGIKFTVLFELPNKKGCVLCRDSQISLISSGKGRRNIEK